MIFRFMSATLLLATPLLAQTVPPAASYTPPYLEADPAEALSRYLRMLASNPRDLASLTGAGKAALDIGDASAALGFYARAEEIEPKNGRIKAGIGSALVQMEQPDTALRFFDDAVRLGVPVLDIALDRGLAHDLRGETRRAQADYQTVLRTGPNAEARRRLALSQAIGGDRAAAQATLRPLLAERDLAARRVNAFVLALTGDSVGASVAANQAMPVEQAAAMLPYLARLPGLKLTEKAAAVHFGRFPATQAPLAPQPSYADATPAQTDARLTPAGERLGGPTVSEQAARSDQARRRPGRETKPVATVKTPAPTPVVSAAPVPSARPVPDVAGAVQGPPVPADFVLRVPQPAPQPTRVTTPVVPPTPPAPDPAEAARLAAKKVEDRKAAERKAAEQRAAEKKAAEKKAAEKKAEADKKAAAAKKAAPERYWVQVASGSNRGDLGKAWTRVRAQNKLLAGKTPWTSSWRASNRLLVGPFPSEREAQNFVNALAKSGMSTMQFTSRGGVQVERLAP
jgi:Flp pilus assembly protein TadD